MQQRGEIEPALFINLLLIMKFYISILLVLIFSFSTTFATDSKVTIVSAWPNQTVQIFSSISNLNNNTSPIATLVTNASSEIEYDYVSSTNTTLYMKANLDALNDEWGLASYLLEPGTDHILYLWVWWNLAELVSGIDDIKWNNYLIDVHSLSSSFSSGWISQADKNDIADKSRDAIEGTGGLLDQILDYIKEIFSRIFSIKSDTQKIQ